MKVQEVLNRTQQFFKTKGFPTARLDAELLLSHSLGWTRVNLYTKFDYPMTEEELNTCREFVKRRSQGEPVAYILEKKAFYNHEFFVNNKVLIPRPDTEALVQRVLDQFAERKEEELRILDLGCGSGCIGLSLLKEMTNATLLAVDLSAEAISVSEINAEKLEVAERCTWSNQDAADCEEKDFDIIVANPPYIDVDDDRVEKDVRDFEPEMALFAKNNGMLEIERWTQMSLSALNHSGSYFCEFGEGQESEVELLSEKMNFDPVFYKDLSGITRGFEVHKG